MRRSNIRRREPYNVYKNRIYPLTPKTVAHPSPASGAASPPAFLICLSLCREAISVASPHTSPSFPLPPIHTTLHHTLGLTPSDGQFIVAHQTHPIVRASLTFYTAHCSTPPVMLRTPSSPSPWPTFASSSETPYVAPSPPYTSNSPPPLTTPSAFIHPCRLQHTPCGVPPRVR